MAREEKTISELTSLATVNRSEDLIPVVDVSDTTDSEYGTTKKTLVSEFIGDKGEAATVDAGTTTTGDAGTNASVVNVGTTSAAVFNFTIPRGNTGATGAAGSDGADGDSAYVYIAYASDASGTGFTTTFNAALDYIAVKATTTEITTPQASDFTGLWKNYKGVQGIQGIQGEIGLTGATGADGTDGVNAYVYIAYASDNSGTGFTTTFDANLDYVAIKTTTTEIVTPQASDFTGLWKNYKGATGATGPAGANGVDGEDGLDINWRGNYASGTAYVINDAVFYSGSSYICKLASTGNLPTNTTYWDLMAQQGAAGTGSGDVSGPASATDNAIARFDLTTGKLIQDSLVTVDDNGSINIPSGQQYLVNGSPVSGYSDEQAQDAVGTILTDTTTVDFTYTDGTPSITADVKDASVANAKLANMATKTYKGRTSATTGVPEDVDVATLKTDLGLVKADVGLGNVDNTSDATKNSATVTLTNKTLTSPVLNTGVSGTAVLDEDDMASNSATKLATQQSIKAYVDAKGFVWKGPWTTLTPYDLNDTVESNGSGYVCTSAHTSGTTTEPGVGASWTDKWDLFVEGTDKTMPTGDIVGTTDTQTLTNKTIDGDTNTISNLAHGAEVDNPASGVHGVTGSVVGTTDTQTLTNKTLTAPALSSPTISGAWDGWISAGETWTYASADDPTFTFTVAADVTTKYSAGMKIKLTQGTVKYFIITAVSTYSGGNTTITVYGGTDYDLANSAISANAYSMMRTPAGFPMSPAKWSVIVRSSTDRQTTSTSYASLTDSITIPIGVWDFNYKVAVRLLTSETGGVLAYTSMTSSGTTETNPDLTVWMTRAFSAGKSHTGSTMFARQVLTATSKTVYTLIGKTSAGTVLAGGSTFTPTVFTATCAYL